ncbi:MAG: pseudouridine synthase [Cyclobacteriaceae bacterium]|nr:pseudouridine synthase [Cyclobacteriaceae bacterium]
MNKHHFQQWILEENEDYIILNKPPFLSSLQDRTDSEDVLSLAKVYFPGAQACHRLDKETSGIMVLSKSEEAYKNLAIQFEKRLVEKIYHAIIMGTPPARKFEINKKLQTSGKDVIVHPDGKPSLTSVEVIEAYKKHTLVLCDLKTGRRHQIRVHLSSIGHPVVHDYTYGGKPIFLSQIKARFNLKKWTDEEPLSKRVALHAVSIKFLGVDGKELKFEAPYPKDFKAIVAQLQKHGR